MRPGLSLVDPDRSGILLSHPGSSHGCSPTAFASTTASASIASKVTRDCDSLREYEDATHSQNPGTCTGSIRSETATFDRLLGGSDSAADRINR